MGRPEKKECSDENPYNCLECGDEGWVYGYNQAIDDWEKYQGQPLYPYIPKSSLPTIEEIEEIIKKSDLSYFNDVIDKEIKELAKAIHKRLRGVRI